MREELTATVRQALDQAQQEARDLNQDFVSTEHLMLGVLAMHKSDASDMLTLGGVNIAELRRRLIEALPHVAEPPVVTGNLPLSPKAHRAINAALVQAQTSGSPRVSSAILLSALLEDCQPAACQAFRDAGGDLEHFKRILTNGELSHEQ